MPACGCFTPRRAPKTARVSVWVRYISKISIKLAHFNYPALSTCTLILPTLHLAACIVGFGFSGRFRRGPHRPYALPGGTPHLLPQIYLRLPCTYLPTLAGSQPAPIPSDFEVGSRTPQGPPAPRPTFRKTVHCVYFRKNKLAAAAADPVPLTLHHLPCTSPKPAPATRPPAPPAQRS